jgi:hypothetical protein
VLEPLDHRAVVHAVDADEPLQQRQGLLGNVDAPQHKVPVKGGDVQPAVSGGQWSGVVRCGQVLVVRCGQVWSGVSGQVWSGVVRC